MKLKFQKKRELTNISLELREVAQISGTALFWGCRINMEKKIDSLFQIDRAPVDQIGIVGYH